MANKILKGILVFIFLIFWTLSAFFGQLFGMAELGIIDIFHSFGKIGGYILMFTSIGSGVLSLLLWHHFRKR